MRIIAAVFSLRSFFPGPGLVYQAPVFKLNITPVLLRKLWWFNHCQWSYASRVWLARLKGPGAVVRPAAKGLILWSKNCRLPHMFPINLECSVGLEEVFIMKWPSLQQIKRHWPCPPLGGVPWEHHRGHEHRFGLLTDRSDIDTLGYFNSRYRID